MAYYLPAWCDKGGNRERKLHMINGTEAELYLSSERKLLEPLLNLPAILLFFCPKSSQSQATVAPLAYIPEWRRAWSHRWLSATCNPSVKNMPYLLKVTDTEDFCHQNTTWWKLTDAKQYLKWLLKIQRWLLIIPQNLTSWKPFWASHRVKRSRIVLKGKGIGTGKVGCTKLWTKNTSEKQRDKATANNKRA